MKWVGVINRFQKPEKLQRNLLQIIIDLLECEFEHNARTHQCESPIVCNSLDIDDRWSSSDHNHKHVTFV